LLRGADPNSGTPLVSASLHGFIKTARILLEFGADPDAKNTDGMTASMAPHWGSPYSRSYAGAINNLLKHPPKLRETTHAAVPPPEPPYDGTMGGGAAAAAVSVAVSPDDAAALATLEDAKDSIISRGSDRRALVTALRAAANAIESTILHDPYSSSSSDDDE
jgi:ankyrin repeat protein